MSLPASAMEGCFCPTCLRAAMAAGLGEKGAVAKPNKLAEIEPPDPSDDFETLTDGS
jgi:hypothetical protein